MLRILLSGCNGQMGKVITQLVSDNDNMEIVAGIDISGNAESAGFPIYDDPFKFDGEADVLIDFSNPASLSRLLDYCTDRKLPAILATTGYTDEQIALIEESSSLVPIFRSANMSIGICLVSQLASQVATLLGSSFNIEITERHHNRKLDSPSGTALLIAESIAEALSYDPVYSYGRHSSSNRRRAEEIGSHSIRGGTIIGDHEVLFAGNNELIEIKHSAQSRGVFANGALRAAEFIVDQKPGLYDMKNLVESVINK